MGGSVPVGNRRSRKLSNVSAIPTDGDQNLEIQTSSPNRKSSFSTSEFLNSLRRGSQELFNERPSSASRPTPPPKSPAAGLSPSMPNSYGPVGGDVRMDSYRKSKMNKNSNVDTNDFDSENHLPT